jgi:tetratricopeptide (TPR) repeat protein
MYYRPKEKKRHPALTLLLLALLTAMTGVLLVLMGIYAGYFRVQTPTLTERFGPTPTPTRPAVLYIADGDQYFAEGKLQQAIDSYEQAIELEPDNDIPYTRQSRLLIFTHDTAKAVDRGAQAVLLNPENPENLAHYCRALDWEAQYSAAFDACSCAIELDPTYAEASAFLSEVYADRGEWFNARATAEEAIEKNFQSMDAHFNMGYVFEVQGRYSDAVEFYENALKLAPKLAPVYVAAGRAHYWLGDTERATELFRQAIRLNPSDAEAFDRLGWAYYTDGDFSRAIDALEQGLGVDPSYEKAWGHLGLVYYGRQNFEKAIEVLPKAIELAENQFLNRAREVEIHAEIQTLTGPDTIPVLRGRFKADPNGLQYLAQIEPLPYRERTPIGDGEELSCADAVVDSIKNPSGLPLSPEMVAFTQTFSQTSGTATLNLSTGNLLLDLQNVPAPQTTPYELMVRFWPNRTDSIGYVQPDGAGNIDINSQFEEKLDAPIEYYYTLGLTYAYMDPPMCDQAVPWLLTSLEKDSSGWNPAWYGLRICPSAQSPPTPVPTWTPVPDAQ